MNVHEQIKGLIDAHFDGRIETADEKTMRAHLPECDDCRSYYERHQVLAEADPAGLGARQRLARGLGLAERKRPQRMFSPIPALVAVAAAAMALLVLWPMLGPDDEGFSSRGPGEASGLSSLLVYRIPPDGPPRLAGQQISAADELAFAYENHSAKARLMVFAVDDTGRIYWYHPAWTDAADNPGAVTIDRGPDRQELPEAIAQPLAGAQVRIYGLFIDEALTVKEVERMVRARQRNTDPLPIRNAVQESIVFQVQR